MISDCITTPSVSLRGAERAVAIQKPHFVILSEAKNPHPLWALQIIPCTALHRKRSKTFTALKDAFDQIPCNLRITGFRNNPVIYVFKIFDCPGPQTDGQAFHVIDFARTAT